MAEKYEDFARSRITELRIAKGISEHKMSLELGRSGSYIRGITSGAAMPSFHEFFNICEYLDVSPSEFFAPLDQDQDSLYAQICTRIREFSDDDLQKIDDFTKWIKK